jgi:hypothetical protein
MTEYEKTAWVNGQAPAINADNLNKIEVIMCKDREEAAAIALYILQNGEL